MTITIQKEPTARSNELGGTFIQRYQYETELFKAASKRPAWNIASGDYSELPSKGNRFSPPTEAFMMEYLDENTPLNCIDVGAGNAHTFLNLAITHPQHTFILHNLSKDHHPQVLPSQNITKITSDYEGLATIMQRKRLPPVHLLHERCGPLSLSLVPELVLLNYVKILSPHGMMVLSNPWASPLLYPKDLIPRLDYVMEERNNALILSLFNLYINGWHMYSFEGDQSTGKRLCEDNFDHSLSEQKGLLLIHP